MVSVAFHLRVFEPSTPSAADADATRRLHYLNNLLFVNAWTRGGDEDIRVDEDHSRPKPRCESANKKAC